ncbi:MAG TPA: hypothetical protein VGH28_15400 [Polyangiaceae bacterium]|jgi:hypothetical protein
MTKPTLELFAIFALLANAACGGGTTNPSDASTDSPADVAKQNDGALPGPDGGDDGAGPTIDPECTAPTTAPSNGSCVTIDLDGGIACNPVTNAGCDVDAGESCDIGDDGTIACFPPPPPNTQPLCATCDSNTQCMPTTSCWPAASNSNGLCMRFCCTDADCGGGHCDKTTFQTDPLGLCAK